ncbi:MAG TPA: GIY-YIG nuclease family protein [Phycisphaerae bacterium]
MMNDLILQAFLLVRDGRSPDAVIADPALNTAFLEACRTKGVVGTPFEVNHFLFNLRKLRALEDHPTTRRIRLKEQDDYRFAVEITARFLELRDHTTLDRIICDPKLAVEFDSLAEQLAPGRSSFEYRFTALSLRKKGGLKPEIVSRVIPATAVTVRCAKGLDFNGIPRTQGVYILFYKSAGNLYVGEATNLRNRIRKHLDHSDRKEIAHWLWEKGSDDLYVEIHELPDGTRTQVRKALELELIRSRRPRFNITGSKGEDI